MRLRRVLALVGALAALALHSPRDLRAQGAGEVAGTVVQAVTTADALRSLVQTAAHRAIESVRAVAPGAVDRLDGLLQGRAASDDATPEPAGARTAHALLQVTGVAVIGLVIALVVLVTALGPLEGVIRTVEADVSGAFWRGLLAQAIVLPLLALVLLGLALTVVGLLLVPIVLLGATIGIAGIGTLGVLALAAVIGRARAADESARSRARLLRALLSGYAVVWLPWLTAALLVAVPVLGLVTRIVALATTWVLVTVGIGAVIRSRGGVRVPDLPSAPAVGGKPAPQPDWSTPTPVVGVVAAPRQ